RFAFEHGLDVVHVNAAPCKIPSVRRFRHIGFCTEQLRRFDYGALKPQVLESVERVVVNKDADWALRGKQMGDVVNRLPELLLPARA
ncbi:MAG TPA: hypothetical protein VHE81_18085, partial [Lacipirellulaceae bacterium]|nr:hypothetical protein [Lacipirellulaceae bacterium]